MDRKNWTLIIWRYDHRCRDTGERLFGRYEYYDKTKEDMKAEIKDLQRLYPDPKYRIDLVERRDWTLTIQKMSNTGGETEFIDKRDYINKDTYEMSSVVGLFYRTMYRSDLYLIGYQKM